MMLSSVNPDLPLAALGVSASSTTETTGTNTTTVSTEMRENRPHCPRFSCSLTGGLRRLRPGAGRDRAGLRLRLVTLEAGVQDGAHSTLDFRIWRYSTTETTTRARVMRKAIATPGPSWKSWNTVR